MKKVFISYRRHDSRYQARMIYDAFQRALPREHLFMDIDSIPPGADFVEILERWVGECEIMLALIGSGWLHATDPKTRRRRLDNQHDFVRIEIREALKRGIPVVLVLLDDAPMPDANDLPDDLKKLVRRQAEFVQFRTFDEDVARLMRKLGMASEAIQAEARSRDAEARRQAEAPVVFAPRRGEPGGRGSATGGAAPPAPGTSSGKPSGVVLRQLTEEERTARALALAESKVNGAEERRLTEFRAAGRIPMLVGDRNQNQTKWILPGAGEPFCDFVGGPEMVVVPAGSFMMGSPQTEPRLANESPLHKVTIDKPFAVGRHAVTRGQFAAFVMATSHKVDGADKTWRNPGFPQDDSHPVTCVNWDDAKAYISWLAAATDKAYRFLTEAEWEYSARAGTTTPFWWGSSITPAQANYDGNRVYAPGGMTGEYRKGTVPVGDFKANDWGLYNVHGNVWEWCEDVWHDNYVGAPTDGSAWLQGGSGDSRVARGGAWYYHPGGLRSAQRHVFATYNRLDFVGFRVARTLTS
jgi:formylglycine-generating enzyme required for sulfatase activity